MKTLLITLATTALFCQVPRSVYSFAPEELKAFYESKPDGTIMKLSKGDHLPLRLDYKGDFLALESPEAPAYTLSVTRDFYLKRDKKSFMLFSLDGKDWKTFDRLITGNASLGLQIEDGELCAHMGASLSER